MIKRSILFATLFAGGIVHAQQLPQPSPKGEVEQLVGLTSVEVEYSRPSARGRKVFGDLVSYGKVWRTGANLNTIIEFEGPVVLEGQPVPAGKYSLFTIPNEDVWVVILNKNIELWGEGDRKPEEDVLQVKVPVAKCDFTETLTIGFADVKDDKAFLELRWENTLVRVKLEADATEQALANIKEAMAQPEIKPGTYHRCARYCVDKGVMLPEALEWAQKAASTDRKYWTLHTLALCQAANGKYKEAVATANESMELAQKEGDNSYVKMNKERIDEWMRKK
ncbi:MAG TPA: DUF2911 domain-containing protein [Flavobacteriales bacterium]|nr:DUF2911 domain-containing protein [Flavobacteriales bacterium]